jgi:hypothetical protein
MLKNKVKENFDDDAVSFLKRIGFEDIQIRNSIRTVIDITDNSDGKTKTIAEFDIDKIIYKLNHLDVFLFNIEIEKKDKDTNDEKLTTIYNNLRTEYGNDVLREWKHGKLALGKGIQKLNQNGKLILNENNHLNCSNLNDIEEYIKKGQI